MRALVDRVDRVLLQSEAQKLTAAERSRKARLDQQSIRAYGIEMEYNAQEATYMTQPDEGAPRNDYLHALLTRENTGLIIDAYACVGSDAIAFMKTFPRSRVHAVQIQNTEETGIRFRRLVTNLRNYKATHTIANDVFQPHGCSAREYVERRLPGIAPTHDTPIALLYLDPPWYGPDGVPYSPSGLVHMINNDMLAPMASQNRKPQVICFKVPAEFTSDVMQPHLDTCELFAMQGYTWNHSIPVTHAGKSHPAYNFHIYTPSAQ